MEITSVNYMHVVPGSEHWTSLDMMKEWSRYHIPTPHNFTFEKQLEETQKRGYILINKEDLRKLFEAGSDHAYSYAANAEAYGQGSSSYPTFEEYFKLKGIE